MTITAKPIEQYPPEDQAFYRFWYGHMLDDLMQPPLANIDHATARYIWDAARRAAPEPPGEEHDPKATLGDLWAKVGGFESPEGYPCFGSWQALSAFHTLIIRGLVKQWDQMQAAAADLRAAPGREPAEEPMPKHWSVTVECNGEPHLTLADDGYSGVPDLNEALVVGAARHLLSFVGYGLPASTFDPDAEEAQPADRYRHKKSGGIYELVAFAEREADQVPLVVYRSPDTLRTWVRPLTEWREKFEYVAAAPPDEPTAGRGGANSIGLNLFAWGVSRMADNPRAVLVTFRREPTDDELRALHDALRPTSGQIVRAAAPAEEAQPVAWPLASPEDAGKGWTLNYHFIEQVERAARQRTDYTTSMEATEQVLIAAAEVLGAPQPADPTVKESLSVAEPVAWVAADTLNSPHPTCISALAYMSQLDRERGREYVPLYAAPSVAREDAQARAQALEWRKPGPVTPDHPLECLVVLESLRQSDGDWWVSGDHFYPEQKPVAWCVDTPENRAALKDQP